MSDDESGKKRSKGLASKAGNAAGVTASKVVKGSKKAGTQVANARGAVAKRTVQGAQAVRPRLVNARTIAKEQSARAAAFTAQQAKRHMPKHVPGEPVRPAILDTSASTSEIVEVEESELPALALLASQYLLADFVTSREQNETRWEKMERVVDRQAIALDEVKIGSDGAVGVLLTFGESLPTTDRIAFVVDLYFLDPFAPYTLKSDKATRSDALREIAVLVGGEDDLVDCIDATRSSALGAHTKRSLGKIGLMGIGAAVALGVAGILAAPLVGAAIGGAAGLGGAAAVSHGLAILGGGALAAGGAGMAGGMWLVAGVGAAAGLLTAGGGTALYELGSATARGELVKLQITFKLGLLDANKDMAKAQQAIANLVAQADATRAILDEERKLNDENSQRVEDLEATLEAIGEAIAWMESEREAVLESA